MSRFVFALLAALSFSSVVSAQTAPGAASSQPVSPAAPAREAVPPSDSSAARVTSSVRPFPLVPILETILAGEISWRPDWPVEVPPDLFAVSGEVRSVTVTLEFPTAAGTDSAGADSSDSVSAADASNPAGSPDSAASPEPVTRFEYALIRDGDGRLTDFPFFMDGGFFQTGVSYDEQGRIAGLTVSAQILWRVEFMEYDEGTGLPVLARINAVDSAVNADAADTADTGAPGTNTAAGSDTDAPGDAGSDGVWFFAALEYRGLSTSETWYDPAGTGLAVYNHRYDPRDGKKRLAESVDFLAGESRTEEYHYDSWGNLTGIGGAYSAVYRENRPQYWRRPFPLPPTAETAVVGDSAATDAALGNAAAGNTTTGDAVSGNAAEDVSSGEIPWRFIFQWDERRLVTRLLGYPEDENAGGEWDARYDYTPDDSGNWKERREIRMIHRGDYLFPRSGVLVSREIDYQGQ